jgi:hypothetical protein
MPDDFSTHMRNFAFSPMQEIFSEANFFLESQALRDCLQDQLKPANTQV